MRTVGVVTVGRSDYGIYRPLLRRITATRGLRLELYVGGMHLAPGFGRTVREIEADGYRIAARVPSLVNDTPAGIAAAMGRGVAGFGRAFARRRPDVLVVLGDRFEMHAAALAALPFLIPVAHIHGGELTQGAIDDALRHSLTKLSHLHFVATKEYARRVRQLGEAPWRVTVAGAPGLDNIRTVERLTPAALADRLGMPVTPAPLLVTFHPATLDFARAGEQVDALLAAVADTGLPVVFTAPNADTNGRLIARKIRTFVKRHATARYVENLGTQAYFSLLGNATAMIGNSSSGLIEAPSFGLPVVNIGDRQAGRVRAANVIDVGYGQDEIAAAIRRASSPAFRARLRGLVNPYGNGHAAERIVARLNSVPLDRRLIQKQFHDCA